MAANSKGVNMGNKLTALMAMIMLISAAGLDSEDWKKPLAVFLVSATWCCIYAVRNSYSKEV